MIRVIKHTRDPRISQLITLKWDVHLVVLTNTCDWSRSRLGLLSQRTVTTDEESRMETIALGRNTERSPGHIKLKKKKKSKVQRVMCTAREREREGERLIDGRYVCGISRRKHKKLVTEVDCC